MTIPSETVNLLCAAAVVFLCVPILYHDLRTHMIPNRYTYVGIGLGLLVLVFLRRAQFLDYSLAFIGGFGLFYIMFLLGWMGGGDVKLIGMIGLLMGTRFLIAALVFISIAGGVLALGKLVYLLARRQPVRGARIPYGTAIVAGTYFTLWQQIQAP